MTCGKACSRAREARISAARTRAWLADNAERFQATTAAYRAANRASRAAAQKTYYAANRDRYARYNKEYRGKQLEATRAYQADWYAKHADRAKARARQRKGRMRANQSFIVTPRDIQRLLGRYRGCCAYCEVKLDSTYHLDHVLPVSRGGAHGIGNLVPACAECNLSKHADFLAVWRYRRLPAINAA